MEDKTVKRILLIGLPGSGKTSHAEHLAIALGYRLIKTSTMLRHAFLEGQTHAAEIKAAMDQGDLVDNQIVSKIVKDAVLKVREGEGFVVDGYPRTIEQLDFFDPQFDKVIYLKLPESEAEERLLKRGRSDDTLELVKKRLHIQGVEIADLKKHYLSIWSEVDANRPMEEVYKDIAQKISNKI